MATAASPPAIERARTPTTGGVGHVVAEVDALAQLALTGPLDPAAAIDQIAALAEQSGNRNARGSFFTPPDVTTYIVHCTLVGALVERAGLTSLADVDGWITDGVEPLDALLELVATLPGEAVDALRAARTQFVVLDPACGAGAFLIAAAHALRAIDRALRERRRTLGMCAVDMDDPLGSVRGADIAPLAVEACRRVLQLDAVAAGAEPQRAWKLACRVIVQRDATSALAGGDWLPAGGVDAVVGNPPYVRAAAGAGQQDLHTRDCRNLYAWVTERALAVVRPAGRCGVIVPVSAVCTSTLEPFRELWRARCTSVWVSSYDTIPSTLFAGTVQRVSILLGRVRDGRAAADSWHTTGYRKWRASERAALLSDVRYVPMPAQRVGGSLAKVGTTLEAGLLRRLFQHPPARELLAPRGSDNGNRFWYKRRWSYFLLFTDFVPQIWDADGVPRSPSEFKAVEVTPDLDARVLLAVYNSSLFYWFFTVFSDNRNVNRRDLEAFPCARPSDDVAHSLVELADELMCALRASSELRECTYRSIGTITNTYFRQAQTKHVLDRIDEVLAAHYGMSARELAFVQRFEERFRLTPAR